MKGLEELLGFRISGSANTCLEHRQVELLSEDGESIKAVRPATHQEVDLWMALLGHEEGMREAQAAMSRAMQKNHEDWASVKADNQSLTASCEAYRRELDNLRAYVEANWVSPVKPPATVPTLDMFAEIVQSHNQQKQRLLDKARELWHIEPGTDIIEFMFQRLRDMNGETLAETEARRRQVIENRANAQRGGRAQAEWAEEQSRIEKSAQGIRVDRGGYTARGEEL